jgi:rhodanese-related sulfurtransferase
MSKIVAVGIILMCFLSGLIGSVAGIKIYKKYFEKQPSITKEYFDTENKVLVSPATLRKMIDDKDTSYILVDLRSQPEYNVEHIIGAVNIPATTLDEAQILAAFKKLPQDKQILLQCYSAYCMLGRQVGQVLANHGIEVKDLAVGWSEWKYYWGLWNPGEDPKAGLKYLEKGTSDFNGLPPKCTGSTFGC